MMSLASIAQAITVEKSRFAAMAALYTEVANAEVLDINDNEVIELNIGFAPITAIQSENVKLEGLEVTIGSISLTVEDTTLHVKDQPYKVSFAVLAEDSGSLVHLELETPAQTSYGDETAFTVSGTDLTFTLPMLEFGSYTIVAYIATDDGIHSSAYIPLAFHEVAPEPARVGNPELSAAVDADCKLSLTYTQITDFNITLQSEAVLDYNAFHDLLCQAVFQYGTPSEDPIEIQVKDAFTALTGEEVMIQDGFYRIACSVLNGEAVVKGYIYAQYTCTPSQATV